MGRRLGRGGVSGLRTLRSADVRSDSVERSAAELALDQEARLLGMIAKERDEKALIALYDRISGSVYACCLRILRDTDEAKDATSETFWRLWTRAERYDAKRCSAMAWIMTVTRRLALDRRRSAVRRSEVLSRVQAEPLPPDDSFVREEARLEIEAAFGRLSSADRRLLESAYFEGLSGADIAARDEVPLGTVKSRMRAALRRLRMALNGGML